MYPVGGTNVRKQDQSYILCLRIIFGFTCMSAYKLKKSARNDCIIAGFSKFLAKD